MAKAINRLAQATLSTADLWLLSRVHSTGSITDDIADSLSGQQIKFTQNEKIIGCSGRPRQVDFQTFHLDDTLNVWTEDNIRQLEEFLDTAYWSHPNELVELLGS